MNELLSAIFGESKERTLRHTSNVLGRFRRPPLRVSFVVLVRCLMVGLAMNGVWDSRDRRRRRTRTTTDDHKRRFFTADSL